jgi:hypothetical protein
MPVWRQGNHARETEMDFDKLTVAEVKQLAALAANFLGSAPSIAPSLAVHAERPVVIWTDKRGVIFGYTSNADARPIVLRNARMCLYWPSSVGGVFGLCDIGPNKDSKIGAVIPSATFEGVTGVASVSPEAEKAWICAKVQGR